MSDDVHKASNISQESEHGSPMEEAEQIVDKASHIAEEMLSDVSELTEHAFDSVTHLLDHGKQNKDEHDN